MQASTADTPTAGHCGTIFVAIELSQKSWLVTLHSPDRDRISRHRVAGGDHAELLAWIVQVPSVEQEDARRASRERDRLVTEQTAHTNRIKALLRLQGMAVGYARRRDWLHWLARQRDWQGQPLSSHLLAEVTREHARLM